MGTADTGHAGEHLVMAELLRRGYAAALTRDGSLGIDVLAASPDGARIVAIQVKTKKCRGPWLLKAKHERPTAVFFVFVDLSGGPSRFFVVPGDRVADYIRREHEDWLRTPGKGGRQHKENEGRHFTFAGWRRAVEPADPPRAEEFEGKWDLLGLGGDLGRAPVASVAAAEG
jgi:hypothetical protein